MSRQNNLLKRLTAVFIMAILVVGVFAGCNSIENKVKTTRKVVFEKTDEKDKPAEKDDLVVYGESSYDSSGDEVSVTVVSYDAAHYYYSEYMRLVDEYGEGRVENGNLVGVAVVRFGDFVGTGNMQMYIAYADGTQNYVNKQAVFGFDNGSAELLSKTGSSVSYDITSTDDGTPAIWIFVDENNQSYLVTGEDMSKNPQFHQFLKKVNGNDIFAFCETSEKLDGTYIKINLTDLSTKKAEDILWVTEENVEVLRELYDDESYTYYN